MTEGPQGSGDDGGNPEDGPILSPEELDIANDEHVTQLDEGRFVVSPEARLGDQGAAASTTDPSPEREPGTESPPEPSGPDSRSGAAESSPSEITDREVYDWLAHSFESANTRYGFDVTATFDGTTSQRRMASNDVVTIFESLILWYAQQIDRDTPVEEILGILLMESNVPVRYPAESLRKLVRTTECTPEDSVADLLRAVEENDGVEL